MNRRNPGVRVPDSWRDLTMRAFAESEVRRGSRDEGPGVVVSLPMDDLRPAYGKLMGNIPKGSTMKLTIQTLASQPWLQGQRPGQGPNVGVTLLAYLQTSTIKGHIPSKKDVFLWRKRGGLRPKERFSIEEVLPGAVEHELAHFIQWWLSPGTPSGRKFGRVRQAARIRHGTGTRMTGDTSPGTSDWEYHAYLLSMGRIISGILRSENKSMDEAIAIAENYYPNHIASFSPSRLAAFRRDMRRVVGRMLEAPKDESIGWIKAQAEAKVKRRRSRKGRQGGRARRNGQDIENTYSALLRMADPANKASAAERESAQRAMRRLEEKWPGIEDVPAERGSGLFPTQVFNYDFPEAGQVVQFPSFLPEYPWLMWIVVAKPVAKPDYFVLIPMEDNAVHIGIADLGVRNIEWPRDRWLFAVRFGTGAVFAHRRVLRREDVWHRGSLDGWDLARVQEKFFEWSRKDIQAGLRQYEDDDDPDYWDWLEYLYGVTAHLQDLLDEQRQITGRANRRKR